ncbi:MAG TPA: hypothetical protein VL287_15455 [Gemmatimonadales bacterium]|jgi:hypothetical protein|nr:hypothetical protein [Gemmatimonadales bacterium]
MASRLPLVLSVVGWFVLGKAGASQQIPPFKTLDEVSSFVQTYYQRPRPELIADLIRSLPAAGLAQRPNATPPMTGFFSEVFAANPARMAEWQPLISAQDASTRGLLEQAVALSKSGGVLDLTGHSASLNDMYWGAFFATGRTVFLQKLVDQLRYVDEREDEALFLAGATAKWSLASNAESHDLVRWILKSPTLTTDQRTQALISELLTEGPAQVKQEMAAVVQKQREAGKWR